MKFVTLGKTNVILDIPWLVVHNPEIDWKNGEVRMTKCPPLCNKVVKIKGRKELRKDKKKIVR